MDEPKNLTSTLLMGALRAMPTSLYYEEQFCLCVSVCV